MRILCATLTGAMLVGLLAGCFMAPVIPPAGLIYTGYEAPLDINTESTQMGARGEAYSHCVLGLVSWGDASIAAAAAEGGIRTVNHADYKLLNVLLVYQRFTTMVYGQ